MVSVESLSESVVPAVSAVDQGVDENPAIFDDLNQTPPEEWDVGA